LQRLGKFWKDNGGEQIGRGQFFIQTHKKVRDGQYVSEEARIICESYQ
jgi:hypothetical protein